MLLYITSITICLGGFLKWLKNPTIWDKSIVIDKPEREGRHVEHLYISTYIDRQCLRLSLHYHSRVSVESAGPCVMKKLLQKCMTHQYVIPYTFLYLYNTYYLSIYIMDIAELLKDKYNILVSYYYFQVV